MDEFKIGDKAKCINNTDAKHITVDKIYEVKGINNNFNRNYIHIINDENIECVYFTKYFELVERKIDNPLSLKFKPDDIWYKEQEEIIKKEDEKIKGKLKKYLEEEDNPELGLIYKEFCSLYFKKLINKKILDIENEIKLRKYEFEAWIGESTNCYTKENMFHNRAIDTALGFECSGLMTKITNLEEYEKVSKWKVTLEEIIE